MHVSALLLGLWALLLPFTLASSKNPSKIGIKRPLESSEINNEFKPYSYFRGGGTSMIFDHLKLPEDLSFPVDILASGESKIVEIISEYPVASGYDPISMNKLIGLSKIFPEETVFHILSMGEVRLMAMKFYYEAYISDEKLAKALKNVFNNISCKKKLLTIFRIHTSLLLNDPDLITPKSVLIGFKNISFDLFSICIERELMNGKNYSKCYKLFFLIYKEINSVHLNLAKDLYHFNKTLARHLPNFYNNLDENDLYRVALNFLFWDDVDELSGLISNSAEIAVFVPQNSSSLLHFATEWQCIESLDFLLDLVHEMANIENESVGVSPFVYALLMQSEPVLEVYAKHGFTQDTDVTISFVHIKAAELLQKLNDPDYSEFLQRLIKK